MSGSDNDNDLEFALAVKRKLPPNLVIPGLLVILMQPLAFTAYLKIEDPFVFLVSLGALVAWFLINVHPDMGYRIAWDADRIYMRDWGFKRWPFARHDYFSIRFEDVKSVKGKFHKFVWMKRSFMPFEYIEVKSKKRGVKDIWIYPPSLRDEEVKGLLFYFHEQRPELFPPDVLDYMHSGKPLSSSQPCTLLFMPADSAASRPSLRGNLSACLMLNVFSAANLVASNPLSPPMRV